MLRLSELLGVLLLLSANVAAFGGSPPNADSSDRVQDDGLAISVGQSGFGEHGGGLRSDECVDALYSSGEPDYKWIIDWHRWNGGEILLADDVSLTFPTRIDSLVVFAAEYSGQFSPVFADLFVYDPDGASEAPGTQTHVRRGVAFTRIDTGQSIGDFNLYIYRLERPYLSLGPGTHFLAPQIVGDYDKSSPKSYWLSATPKGKPAWLRSAYYGYPDWIALSELTGDDQEELAFCVFGSPATFTYQGRLTSDGTPFSGSATLSFSLFDRQANGSLIGTEVLTSVPVADGLFTVELNSQGDFGSMPFGGSDRWLEIAVNDVSLSPRQHIAFAPMALFANQVPWQGIIGAPTIPDITLDAAYRGGHAINADDGAVAIDGTGGLTVAGKVGIGTTSPSDPLQVVGVIRSSSGGFEFPDGTTQTSAAKGDGFSLDADDGAPTDAVYIDAAGQVGIGTKTPENRLSILGGSDASLSGGGFLQVGGAGGANLVLDDDEIMARNNGVASTLFLQGDGGNVVIGDSTAAGRFGINTDSPAADLHVRGGGATGEIRVTPNQADGISQLYLSENTSGSYAMILRHDSTGGGALFRIRSVGGGTESGDLFTIKRSDGRVGIGRTSSANAFEVEGKASKTEAGSWLANSDRRIKTRVAPVSNALEKLDMLNLVRFRYTEEYRAAHPTLTDHEYVNVIAQEFAEVFPDWVQGSGEYLADGSEILQVDTYPITIYTAAAVQQLHATVSAQAEEIAHLREVNESLCERVQRIEQQLRTAPATHQLRR